MNIEKSLLQEKVNRGIKYFEENKFDKATEIFENLRLNKNTKSISYLFLGIISIKKKENFKAKELFIKILSINEFHLEANFNLALVYFSEDNYDEALNYFNISIKINDKHLPSYYHKGLMQLMPYTAKLVSKQAKLPYSKSRLTTDPEYNINLGSHYIAGLILEYDGAYPFAIAAYNAGPKRVRYWKKINKNPQKKQINYVDWIELIKFKETRNYVQRVLENYNVYRYILAQKPILMKNFFKDEPLY